MSLSFQSAGALAALPLAAAPWLLHRWSRARAARLDFPSLALLKAAVNASFSSSLVTQRLLLAARTLLALAAVFLAARPVATGGAGPSGAEGDVVVAVDVSVAMDARVAGRSALEWARDQAAAFAPAAGRRAGLVAFSDRVEALIPPTEDAARWKDALGRLSVTARPGRPTPGLSAAYGLLSGKPAGTSVVVLSALTRAAWTLPAAPPGFDPAARAILARAPLPDGNAGVLSVRPSARAGELGTMDLSGWGRAPSAARGWTFSWDGRPAAQGRWGWKEGRSSLSIPFTSFPSDAAGEAALERDAFPDDDLFHVLPPGGKDVSILVLDGAPALTPAASETYFLATALAALKGDGVRFKVVTEAVFSSEELSSVDVVVLANAPALPAPAAARLAAFVEKGGGLWVSAGDRFDPGLLAPLLPARPTGTWGGEGGFEPSAAWKARRGTEDGFEWGRLETSRFLKVVPAPEATVLLTGKNGGDPLLIVGKRGRGRTAFLTTTLDADWTNLPARPVYPVLCRELLDVLSGEAAAAGVGISVDQPWEGPLPSEGGGFSVRRPDGFLDAPSIRGKNFSYARTDRPGIYALVPRGGGNALARAAVNLDAESGAGDFTPADGETLRRALPAAALLVIAPGEPVKARFDESVRGKPLAPLLSLIVLLLLAAETFLLGVMKR